MPYRQNMCSGFWDKYCTIGYKAQAFAVRILGPDLVFFWGLKICSQLGENWVY